MVVSKRIKAFDYGLLDQHPDLKEFLKPRDQYPELEKILKNRPAQLPVGSFNTKVIIYEGEIIERVYTTPKGQVISLFSNLSHIYHDHVA